MFEDKKLHESSLLNLKKCWEKTILKSKVTVSPFRKTLLRVSQRRFYYTGRKFKKYHFTIVFIPIFKRVYLGCRMETEKFCRNEAQKETG